MDTDLRLIMNCIDAIEGNVKEIISRLHAVCVSDRIEETEYIRCVRIVIEATDIFLSENREITPEPDIVHRILLSHAKTIWLETTTVAKTVGAPPGAAVSPEADREYLNYYFDHLYHHGDFPL